MIIAKNKKWFDPLLILYSWNKEMVYNFNGRFIWTVGDRTAKIQKKHISLKLCIDCIMQLICISIWPLRKTWLGTCGDHGGQAFLAGLHTSLEGFCPTPRSDPLQVIKVLRFGYSNLQLLHRLSMRLGHSRTFMCFFLRHSFVTLAVCFGSFSCLKTHPQPFSKHHVSTSMFDGGDGVLGVIGGIPPPPNTVSWVDAKELDIGLIWSQDCHTALLWILGRLQTCAFRSRGSLWAPSRRSVLPIIFLVTMVQAALRSLTRSSGVVLGWFLHEGRSCMEGHWLLFCVFNNRT